LKSRAFQIGTFGTEVTTRPIRTLRNRIAHHEPIIAWDLPKHYRRMIEMTGWLCPAAADWCEAHSRFLEAYPREGIILCSDDRERG
jgi:hypothetical protein